MKLTCEALLEILCEGLIKVSGDNRDVLIAFLSPARDNN